MKTKSSETRSVEQLERFGKPLADMPKEAFKGQGKTIFAAFKHKFGLIGIVPFALQVVLEHRRILKQYARQYRELREITAKGADEITMLIAMFNVIARKESREDAYEFVKGIFQDVALKSLPVICQLDDLVRCEGDVFDNFKRFNVAMFEAGNSEFRVKEIEETNNHL